MPRSGPGPIVAVKTGVTEAFQAALQGSSLGVSDQAAYVGMEYPMEPLQYPGVWVRFAVSKLNRMGIGHEVTVQTSEGPPPTWAFVQEWEFEGTVTLTVLATKSLDRDRLVDSIIGTLAFARPPDQVLMMPEANTLYEKSLITVLDENPYVALTLQLDTLIPGGPEETPGTPWSDDLMTYQDSWSFNVVGNFNLQFNNDGIYTLSEIVPNMGMNATQQPYNPAIWAGQIPNGPVGPNQATNIGTVNTGNTDIPAM
jgi:hypothetical protein